MTIAILLAATTLLIFINSFYVAAQFSSVVARQPRLAQLAEDGNPRAGFVLDIVEDTRKLDTYIATCQVGITVSSLALGFYGQARVMTLLDPALGLLNPGVRVLVTSITAFMVLMVFTILQVIFGELLPKNVGLLHPERLAIMTASGMRWSLRILSPLIWLLNGSGTLILHLIGSDVASEDMKAHTPAEIEILVEESRAGGVLDDEERRLFINTLRLRNATAQRAMIPRNSMLAAPVSMSCEELFSLLAGSPYSRLPLYADSIDEIVGVIHLKDLLCAVHRNEQDSDSAAITAANCLHPPLFVPELADIGQLMSMMQKQHQNLAIVVDEYGGTAGMITLEDLIEEIVGDFSDEFDEDSAPIELTEDNRLRIQGDVSLDDVEELLDINLQNMETDTHDIETIGGLVLAVAGRIPSSGNIVSIHGLPVRADSVVNNRIVHVSIPITQEQTDELLQRLEAL